MLRQHAALLLMAASGFAGLGYQIVWTQQSALWLGHETAAVLAVVAAFFGGLAVGALALGRRIERSPQPLRWYAAGELLIALWSGVLIFAMAPLSAWALALTGEQPTPAWQWAVAFCASFAMLMPATAAMGATLPAMVRVTASAATDKTPVAVLYAANTFGAVLGVIACAFWLLPTLGLQRTTAFCAVLNVGCAAVSLILFPRTAATPPSAMRAVVPGARRVLALLALTGLLGIGYEVLVVRVLSQMAEDTVYTFALLLAVYLVGSAAGAAAWQRGWGRSAHAGDNADRLLSALAWAGLIGCGALWAAQEIQATLLRVLGNSMAAALCAEAALAAAAFALPTMAMGALFSQLCADAAAAGVGFARALGCNTLGAAVAPLAFGVLLAPAVGPKLALLTIVVGYLALAGRSAWRSLAAKSALGAAAALALWAPPLAFVEVPAGGRVLSYQDGVTAAVSVVEDAEGVSRLRINNRQQEGSSATLRVDARQALLPLLLHPAPRRALFLGLGTGVTAGSAAQDQGLQVDAVELLPEVIAASHHFSKLISDGAPRLRLIAADARRYVRTSPQRYDLIVADNFHPARSGSGALYTVEHFAAVRNRLAVAGLFCQWLPLHQLDLATLRSIVRSFLAVYPDGSAMLASNSLSTPVLGLVGRERGRFDAGSLAHRLASNALLHSPAEFGIEDEWALLGSFVAGPSALARFAGGTPANTDDRPIVTYRAPRITYAPDSDPADRLISLLQELAIEPDELLAAPLDPARATRLAAYWAARNRFIAAGRGVRPTSDPARMLAQVQEPLLAVLKISPDFRPAYDPLLRIAQALVPTMPAAARGLLAELAHLQPARLEARQALQQMAAVP